MSLDKKMVAAVDLGSNSFHMIVATLDETGTLSVIDKLRETVRLRAGLTKEMFLDEAAQVRAFKCLTLFSQRLRALPPQSVRVVGTNTLRIIKNSDTFIEKAEEILGYPIDIISGQEEARLIYLGVAHGRAASEKPRLVIDIGGGSTEFILGEGKDSRIRESLEMGCVSFTQQFFSHGMVDKTSIDRAVASAKLTLHPVAKQFHSGCWAHALGCSGTIKSIRNVVHLAGWSEEGITLVSLYKLKEALLKTTSIENLSLEGLSSDRAQILAGGLSILIACFESLKITVMKVSEHSLREGVLYELVDRITHHDTRETTVQSLMKKWSIDVAHANQVSDTVSTLAKGVNWNLDGYLPVLIWAVKLHEIGLQVAHAKQHEHGAYILAQADLPGFSRAEQQFLSELVLNQRRKLDLYSFASVAKKNRNVIKKLGVLLRLGVLLHRGRSTEQVPGFTMQADKKDIDLLFPEGWLEQHPLTRADLLREQKALKKIDFALKFA